MSIVSSLTALQDGSPRWISPPDYASTRSLGRKQLVLLAIYVKDHLILTIGEIHNVHDPAHL